MCLTVAVARRMLTAVIFAVPGVVVFSSCPTDVVRVWPRISSSVRGMVSSPVGCLVPSCPTIVLLCIRVVVLWGVGGSFVSFVPCCSFGALSDGVVVVLVALPRVVYPPPVSIIIGVNPALSLSSIVLSSCALVWLIVFLV